MLWSIVSVGGISEIGESNALESIAVELRYFGVRASLEVGGDT